jgi:hypothetical protein
MLPHALRAVLSPPPFVIPALPRAVIPSEAARSSFPRRLSARRAAEWSGSRQELSKAAPFPGQPLTLRSAFRGGPSFQLLADLICHHPSEAPEARHKLAQPVRLGSSATRIQRAVVATSPPYVHPPPCTCAPCAHPFRVSLTRLPPRVYCELVFQIHFRARISNSL